MTFNKKPAKKAKKRRDSVAPLKSIKKQNPKYLEDDAEVKGIGFNWFPGHMKKASDDIKAKLPLVDLVLEIRDARAPIVTGNPLLKKIIGSKSHLIVLNKINLADPAKLALWQEWFKQQGESYLFINIMDKGSLKLILSYARKIIDDKHRASNPEKVLEKKKYRFMIVGLPNTGKSTLINQMASRQATKAANKPALTRVQIWVKVDDGLELLDTPGIMPPKIEKEEHKLWLSTLNTIPDGIIEAREPACFLIEYFLNEKSLSFKQRYQLNTFDLSMDEVLNHIAALRGCLRQKGIPDLERVYKLILMDFHNGELGKVCFGLPPT